MEALKAAIIKTAEVIQPETQTELNNYLSGQYDVQITGNHDSLLFSALLCFALCLKKNISFLSLAWHKNTPTHSLPFTKSILLV